MQVEGMEVAVRSSAARADEFFNSLFAPYKEKVDFNLTNIHSNILVL